MKNVLVGVPVWEAREWNLPDRNDRSQKRVHTWPLTRACPYEGSRCASTSPSSERVKLPRGTCRSKWKGKKCQLCSHHSGAVGWHLPPPGAPRPAGSPALPSECAHIHLPPLCPNYFRSRETPDARRAPRRRQRPRLIHCAKAADATSRLRPVPWPAPGCVRAWSDGGEEVAICRRSPHPRGGPRPPGARSPVPSFLGCSN